jgi:hypothetical protein
VQGGRSIQSRYPESCWCSGAPEHGRAGAAAPGAGHRE